MNQYRTLDEVVNHLYEGMSDSDIETIREKGFQNPFLGMQFRNSFVLWWNSESYKNYLPSFWRRAWMFITMKKISPIVSKKKPALVHFFNMNGFYHADDMSLAIMEALKAKIDQKRFNLFDVKKRVDAHWGEQGVDPKQFMS